MASRLKVDFKHVLAEKMSLSFTIPTEITLNSAFFVIWRAMLLLHQTRKTFILYCEETARLRRSVPTHDRENCIPNARFQSSPSTRRVGKFLFPKKASYNTLRNIILPICPQVLVLTSVAWIEGKGYNPASQNKHLKQT